MTTKVANKIVDRQRVFMNGKMSQVTGQWLWRGDIEFCDELTGGAHRNQHVTQVKVHPHTRWEGLWQRLLTCYGSDTYWTVRAYSAEKLIPTNVVSKLFR